MKTILLALLRFFKTKEDGKSGPGKCCYFLLPNNRSIRVGVQYSTACEKYYWMTGSKHDIQIQKQPPEVFYKKGVPRNFAKFTGKNPCHNTFLNKVAGLRTATLLKKRLWHRCFPVNFVKFLRTPFLQNTSGRLLLQIEN